MEQLKVLAAALALRDFTVDELSGLSGVNPSTVRSVLRRNATLVHRVDRQAALDGTARDRLGRGRPASRWVVVDGDRIRQLIDEIGTLPRFESDYTSIDADDLREAAVAVAEDALAQVGYESDEELRERLISSARSSLFFGERSASQPDEVPWWETNESRLAVRARGVDALAILASLASAQPGRTANVVSKANVLNRTARHIAKAMLAIPERAEETYFVPFSQILARSGEFAPLYAVCALDQEPRFPLVGDWTEVVLIGFHTTTSRILTQAWATPLVNVSACMPIVVSSTKLDRAVDKMINSVKITPRPAVVFGPLYESGLIRKSGLVGASFVPIDEPGSDRQPAIDSVLALIDRFSAGRSRQPVEQPSGRPWRRVGSSQFAALVHTLSVALPSISQAENIADLSGVSRHLIRKGSDNPIQRWQAVLEQAISDGVDDVLCSEALMLTNSAQLRVAVANWIGIR